MSESLTSSPDENPKFDISIFISCYNEEEHIVSAITNAIESLEKVGLSWEIVIIDDVSQDNSIQRILKYKELHPEQPIVLKVNEINKGLAFNFVEAAFVAKGKYFRLVFGDNPESKEALQGIFKHIGKTDVIIPYQTSTGRSFARDAISRLFTGIINFLAGYNIKYYNGSPVFRRYDVLRWHSYATGFGFQADTITRMLNQGVSYMQVPSWTVEKKHGQSTALNFKNFLSVSHTILAVLVRRVSSWIMKNHHKKSVEVKLEAKNHQS